MITPETLKKSQSISTYIKKADEALLALGYTEHSFAHVTRVAAFAESLLLKLGYDARTAELAWMAGYLHDIGNIVNRIDHAQSGAVMAFRILDKFLLSSFTILHPACFAISSLESVERFKTIIIS